MFGELKLLYLTAAAVALFHTILGPDHYIPFIVMAKARKWSLLKTCLITLSCGLGHIISSVVLGMIGLFLGFGVMKLETLETIRGNLAGWALIGFGLAYFFWGLRNIFKNKPHQHLHIHPNSSDHEHSHIHTKEHAHVHDQKGRITPWILFTIFVLGPCEPLIPILMYPAAKNSLVGLIGVTVTFGLVTVITMLGVVIFASFGVNILKLGKLERYAHALAGLAILICGLAIHFLGL